jgi:hypothetical protein
LTEDAVTTYKSKPEPTDNAIILVSLYSDNMFAIEPKKNFFETPY